MLIIIIELLVVLLALYLGSKYGSLALGAIAVSDLPSSFLTTA